MLALPLCLSGCGPAQPSTSARTPGSQASLEVQWFTPSPTPSAAAVPRLIEQSDLPVKARPFEGSRVVRQKPIRPIHSQENVILEASARILTFDPKIPEDIYRKQLKEDVTLIYDMGDYQTLDSIADTLRQKQIYDHSGSWVLQNLYDIIAYNIVLPPDRWLEKNPRSIAAHVIKGKYEIRLAWGARGNGLGSSVSHQAWLEFRKHLFEAEKVLLAGTKVGQDPFLYAQLIIVAKGLSQDRKKARQYLD